MLQKYRCQNFRNLKDCDLDSFGHTNLIYGLNGSGKSNFLESLFLLSYAQAMRPVPLAELVQWHKSYFFVAGIFQGASVECGFHPGKKVLKYNEDRITASRLPALNPIVAFLPQDIDIITGEPQLRRQFLDQSIMLSDPAYLECLRNYNRSLRQRNAQIKQDVRQTAIWNPELIKWGSMVIDKRLRFIRSLNRELQSIYERLYDEKIILRYLNTFKIEKDIAGSYARALEGSKKLESIRGHTLVGPHRDNFIIEQSEKSSRVFASQGQTRALSLALKLGTLLYTHRSQGLNPLILLDDVLLEIDQKRREIFLDILHKDYPVFFTSTARNSIVEHLEPDASFQVSEGHIQREA